MDNKLLETDSESEDETFPCAQKCARCGRYLLQGQKIIHDPKHKNWYSHANCVKLYITKNNTQIIMKKKVE